MGSVKLEQHQKLEANQERGNEVVEKGDVKLEDAVESEAAMSRIEAVDDDDKAALEAGRSESDSIAKELASVEVREPGKEVSEGLLETSEQSNEYADTEEQDAEAASEMVGDYEGVGGNLENQFEQSAQEFREIAEQSDQSNSELEAEFDRIASALESTF